MPRHRRLCAGCIVAAAGTRRAVEALPEGRSQGSQCQALPEAAARTKLHHTDRRYCIDPFPSLPSFSLNQKTASSRFRGRLTGGDQTLARRFVAALCAVLVGARLSSLKTRFEPSSVLFSSRPKKPIRLRASFLSCRLKTASAGLLRIGLHRGTSRLFFPFYGRVSSCQLFFRIRFCRASMRMVVPMSSGP